MLLIAYDAPYPEPLFAARGPFLDAFAVALVLAPAQKPARLPALEVRLSDATAEHMSDPTLEALRRSIPAARSLPLLELLALRTTGTAVSTTWTMRAWLSGYPHAPRPPLDRAAHPAQGPHVPAG